MVFCKTTRQSVLGFKLSIILLVLLLLGLDYVLYRFQADKLDPVKVFNVEIKRCVCARKKLSYDKVPHPKSSFSSSFLGSDTIPRSLPKNPCRSPSHLSPLGDKKALLRLVTASEAKAQQNSSLHACAFMLNIACINAI